MWWQEQQCDVARHDQTFSRLVPAGTIADQHSMGARCDLRADFSQVKAHYLGVCAGRDDGGTPPALRADGIKDVGRVMMIIAQHQRA